MNEPTAPTSIIKTPRGDITLRPTRQEDAAAYRELRLEALRGHPEAFGSDYQESLARPLEYWQDRMRQGAGGAHGVTYVADAGAQLVGMTVLYREEGVKERHSGHIYSVYLHPAWRGLGLAVALIEACVAWARELGLRQLKLGVVTTNAAAIRRYVECGFSVYGVDAEVIYYGGVYYDELLMIRRIS
jgi:RimJ/RimL family protein N-acetyltransferase